MKLYRREQYIVAKEKWNSSHKYCGVYEGWKDILGDGRRDKMGNVSVEDSRKIMNPFAFRYKGIFLLMKN